MGNKKGVRLPLWTIVDVVFITVLILAVFSFLNDVKEDTYFQKRFLSKDVGLLINTAQYLPGDVSYMYSDTLLPNYIYKFKEYKVAVSEPKEDIGGYNYISFPFYKNTFLMQDFTDVEKPSTLYFSKAQDVIRVNSKGDSFCVMKCPDVQGEKMDRVFIVHKNSKEAAGILNSVIDNSAVYEKTPETGFESPFLLKIKAEKGDKKEIEIRYLKREDNTYALGCHIKNKLTNSGHFGSVRYLPWLNMIDFKGPSLEIIITYQDRKDLEMMALGVKEGIETYENAL